MSTYGRLALLAIACSAAPLAAHAQGNFFLGAQVGQARLDIDGLDKNTASTQLLDFGYRWQAGPYVQVGVEASFGKVGELSQSYTDYYYSTYYESTVDTSLVSVGANARFQLGADSHFFAIARAGLVRNHQDGYAFEVYYDPYYGNQTTQVSYTGSDVGGYAGGGIGYDITPAFNVSAMLNAYVFGSSDYTNGGYSGSTVTVGAELRF